MHVVKEKSLGIFILTTEKKMRSVEFRHLSSISKRLSCLRRCSAWCSQAISQFKTASVPRVINQILHAIGWTCNRSEEQRCSDCLYVCRYNKCIYWFYRQWLARMATYRKLHPDWIQSQTHMQSEFLCKVNYGYGYAWQYSNMIMSTHI